MDIPPPQPRPPTPGAPQDPDGVVGRDQQVADAYEWLGAGENLLVTEPRRIGKTAFLTRLCDQAPAGWHALYISYEGLTDAEQVATITIDRLSGVHNLTERVVQSMKAFFNRVDGIGPVTLAPGLDRDPTHALDKTLERLNAQLGDEHLLLAVDEVPAMISAISAHAGPTSAKALTESLRRFRQDHRQIKWVITGSVGFHHIIPAIGGTDALINDLERFELGPLDPEWATWLAECLMLHTHREINSKVIERAVDLTDRLPFLIHLTFKHLRRDHDVGPDDVDRALDDAFIDLDKSRNLTHLLTRLDAYYGDDAALAEWILDRLAASPGTLGDLAESTPTDAGSDRPRVRRVTNLLRSDHYLLEERGALRWRYDSLRRLWVHRRPPSE